MHNGCSIRNKTYKVKIIHLMNNIIIYLAINSLSFYIENQIGLIDCLEAS